ncbi:MAG: UDP-N-acetylglucosamine 1-carboxyvinyltransferase [Oscillospiraceae bacterium]
MEKIIINGGNVLKGSVNINGAKNAAVAILPAAVLASEPCVIENIPNISDISILIKILNEMGAVTKLINKSTLYIDPSKINKYKISYDLARQLRASYYFMGALLSKFKKAEVPLPGGCDFCVRPIDQHQKVFESLGATVNIENGVAKIYADNLKESHVFFDVVSVGATINGILASVLTEGVTILENVAKEPHIVDVSNFLNTIGADIRGAGTDTIKVHGVKSLKGGSYSIIPDQIEAGTYMTIAAITKGDILVKNVIPKHLEPITAKLSKMGLEVTEFDEAIRIRYSGELTKMNIKTMPHPGFPTDMQSQFTTLLTVAQGTSIVTEGVWDNRFKYIEELVRMGASIQVDGRVAVVEGIDQLKGAKVKATDLRGGAAVIIAGLAAEGITEIEDIHHIERGYGGIIEKLKALGADIKKVYVPEREEAKAL